MIPTDFLTATEGHALGTVGYGGAGLWKTLVQHTLPGPVLNFDFEEGNVALMPWTRRRRNWNERGWIDVSQDFREKMYKMIDPKKMSVASNIKPSPIIDTIWYDNMQKNSYFQFVGDLGAFDVEKYNSLSLDSLAEFSFTVQTSSKDTGKEMDELKPNSWGTIQERTAIQLRRMRNYRNSGVFIYFTGQENIDKDYVVDPRSTAKGSAPAEPFAIKGTVSVPGKMVEAVQHITDLMFHHRMMNGFPAWVTMPEPIGAGSGAFWEAKDRTGRIKEQFVRPNFRTIFKDIYGEEDYGRIYNSAAQLLAKG